MTVYSTKRNLLSGSGPLRLGTVSNYLSDSQTTKTMNKYRFMERMKGPVVDENPHRLTHDERDLQNLAHAVLHQAVKDLQSKDADVYGAAWDFLTGKTPQDKLDLDFWASTARLDVKVITEWAEGYEDGLRG